IQLLYIVVLYKSQCIGLQELFFDAQDFVFNDFEVDATRPFLAHNECGVVIGMCKRYFIWIIWQIGFSVFIGWTGNKLIRFDELTKQDTLRQPMLGAFSLAETF